MFGENDAPLAAASKTLFARHHARAGRRPVIPGRASDLGNTPRAPHHGHLGAATGPSTTEAPHPPPTPAPPLIAGREIEKNYLRGLLDQVSTGPPGVAVLLTGDSGAGKTALAEWCLAQAQLLGTTTCVRATCEPFHAGMSFFPIMELTRRLAGPSSTAQSLIEAGYGAWSNELHAAERAFDDSTDQAARREYIMATFANSVVAKTLVTSEPVVIFLDDLERIDTASVDALTVLLSRLDEARVLLLAAFRQDIVSADHEHPLRPIIDRSRRGNNGVHLLELGPLPDSDFVSLVTTFLGTTQDIPELFLRRLLRETEGNPLHVREILRGLRSVEADGTQKLHQRADGSWDFGAASELWDLPKSIEDAIATRLTPLTDRERSVLEAAAVIGRRCRFEMLAAVTGLPEQELLDDLDSLVSRDLLREAVADPDSVEFTHGKIRDVVYGQLTGLRRTRLHAQVAEVFDSQRELLPPDEWEIGMGWHLLKARKYDAASPHLIRAGEHSLAMQAGQEASLHFRDALEALEKSNAPDPRKLAEVRLKLGESLKLASQLDAALRELEPVAASADSGIAQRWALNHIGDIFKLRDRIDEALKCYSECESLARGANDRELIAEVAADLAELHMRESERLAGLDPAESVRHDKEYKRYLDIETDFVNEASSNDARARCFRNRAKYARAHGDPVGAITLYEQSLSIGNHGVTSHQLIIPYAKALRLVGRSAEALAQVDIVLDWSRQIGAPRSEAIARQYRGLLLLERALSATDVQARISDLGMSRSELSTALRLHEETGFKQGYRETGVDLFELEIQEGHLAEAILSLRLTNLYPEMTDKRDSVLVDAVLAQLRANGEAGRADRIASQLSQLGWPTNPLEVQS